MLRHDIIKNSTMKKGIWESPVYDIPRNASYIRLVVTRPQKLQRWSRFRDDSIWSWIIFREYPSQAWIDPFFGFGTIGGDVFHRNRSISKESWFQGPLPNPGSTKRIFRVRIRVPYKTELIQSYVLLWP